MEFAFFYSKPYKSLHKAISTHEHLVIFIGAISLVILSRVVFQPLPSVDPLLPIILFAGARLGKRDGAVLGASAYYASNFFVVGGQGIWTIPMVIGAAGVGYCGAFFKNKYKGIIIGTVFYQMVVNLFLIFMFNPLFALPFAVVHLVSNVIFVGMGEKVLKRIRAEPRASTRA